VFTKHFITYSQIIYLPELQAVLFVDIFVATLIAIEEIIAAA